MRDQTLEELTLKIMALCGEVDEVVHQHECTLNDTLFLIAYLYVQVEMTYLKAYPDDLEGAKRYLAVRFAKYAESARRHFAAK